MKLECHTTERKYVQGTPRIKCDRFSRHKGIDKGPEINESGLSSFDTTMILL